MNFTEYCIYTNDFSSLETIDEYTRLFADNKGEELLKFIAKHTKNGALKLGKLGLKGLKWTGKKLAGLGKTTYDKIKNNKLDPKKKKKLIKTAKILGAAGVGQAGLVAALSGDGHRLENLGKFTSNYLKNPIAATYDNALWTADKAGAPSNVTNYLRDIPNNLMYRGTGKISAAAKKLVNLDEDKSIDDYYQDYMKDPSLLQRWTTMEPLTNSNGNYNHDQLKVIKDMAGKKGYITGSDIKRVSDKYGDKETSLSDYVSKPDKVVQTSIGRTGKTSDSSKLKDVYDFNVGKTGDKDNEHYENAMNEEGKQMNYTTMRALAPILNSTSIQPDKYKIHTDIDLNKISEDD